jgi:hypothetical protein
MDEDNTRLVVAHISSGAEELVKKARRARRIRFQHRPKRGAVWRIREPDEGEPAQSGGER